MGTVIQNEMIHTETPWFVDKHSDNGEIVVRAMKDRGLWRIANATVIRLIINLDCLMRFEPTRIALLNA